MVSAAADLNLYLSSSILATEGVMADDDKHTDDIADILNIGTTLDDPDWVVLADAATPAVAKVRAPVAKDVVTKLSDLTGYRGARDWGLQLADDLLAYVAGDIAWSDVDGGLLLSGAPGMGKSFYARALAAERGVPLIVSGYSDWENKTGSGNLISKAISKVFADARKQAPCILFIDEIDTVASRQNRNWWPRPASRSTE
jgi:hypothetical protein